MTRKFLFGTMAAVAMFFASSCSNELDVIAPEGGESTVSVSLDIPQKQMGSRAFSDGTTAQQLEYAVYEKSSTGDLSLLEGMSATGDEAETIELKKQITFRLLNDHTYVFVFWAASEDTPYTVDFGESGSVTMTADYDEVNANDENLDAFYATKEIKVTGSTKMDVDLYRPFAQINIGTNDLEDMKEAEHEVKTVSVTVSNVYKSFDLMTGYVTGQAESVTFAAAALPTGETFPVSGYDYLAMNYVLVGQENETDEAQKLVTVEFTATNEVESETTTRRVGNVPVQRNYRTNIFGQIFTSDVDLNVEIKPDYEKPDYNYDQLLLAAQIGGKVTLTDDVVLPKKINFTKSATVDLNGKTVTSPSTGTASDDGVFYVDGGATVTITGNGKMTTAGNYASILVWAHSGDVIIENGTFEATNPGEVLYAGGLDAEGNVVGGTIYIKGGTFKSAYSEKSQRYSWILNCYDAAYKQGLANFVVTGGTFYNYDPSNSESENPKASFVPAGYKVVMTESGEDKIYTVVKEGTTVVSSAEELKDALGTLEDGSTIALVNGTELKLDDFATIKGKENITIEGNGATITIGTAQTAGFSGTTFKNVHFNGASENYRGMQHSSNLTFVDCTLDGLYFLYAEGCEFNNCVFNQTASAYNVWTYSATPVTFNNCTFNSTGRGVNVYADGGFTQEVTFNNCKFNASAISEGKAAIEIGNFGYNSEGKITVNINNCTSEGFDLGNNSKNNLWNHKDAYNNATEVIVNVDGKNVYTASK